MRRGSWSLAPWPSCFFGDRRSTMERITPLLWLLFSAGGTVAALLFPVHLFLTGLAFPLGWLEAPGYEYLHRLLTHLVIRPHLFVLISLPLFHWAPLFRYTLYDG